MLEGKQYPLLVRTPRDGGAETVLLDCNVEAGDELFRLWRRRARPDHRCSAWAADRQGSEFYTIHIVRDLATGKPIRARSSRTARRRRLVARLQAPSTTPSTTTTTGRSACAATCSARRRADDAIVYEEKPIRGSSSAWARR